MSYWDYTSYIVPLETEEPLPSRQPPTRSYEEPWWVDTINRGIERAAQVASLEAAGYPPYPEYRTQTPQPVPLPAPVPGVTPQSSQQASINIPTNMLLWGLIFGAFFLAGRRR